MQSLPIPKLRSSWFSAIILAVLSFFVYYLIFFPFLLHIYDQQFYKASYQHINAFRRNGDPDDLKSLEMLEIMVRAPQYIYSAGLAYVFVSVTNESDITLRDVGVYLASKNPPPFIIPSLYSAEVFNTGIVFEEIPPQSTVTGRIILATQSDFKLFNITIVTDSAQEGRYPTGETPTLAQWKWKALQHSFIETLLLPPWSNSLIFALVMFSSYLVHKKTRHLGQTSVNDDDEEETFTNEWLKCVWVNMKWSLAILLVIVFLISVFIIDWLFFVVMYLVLICMIYLAWRFHELHGPLVWFGLFFWLSSLYQIFFDYSNIRFVWEIFPVDMIHRRPLPYDLCFGLLGILSFSLILFITCLAMLSFFKNTPPFVRADGKPDPSPQSPPNPSFRLGHDDKSKDQGARDMKRKNARESGHGMDHAGGEKAPSMGFFRSHDQIMAGRISTIIEDVRGKDDEVGILTYWDGQLRDGNYGENSELWRWINKRRAVSPDIQRLIEKIKNRNPKAGMEKQKREREIARQLKISQKTTKGPDPENKQNDAPVPAVNQADDSDKPKADGAINQKDQIDPADPAGLDAISQHE